VLLGGAASMAAASQHALPGEALYPVKRGLENASTSLATSQAGRGREVLAHASDRLDEVQGLVAAGAGTGDPQVPGALDEFTRQAREGSRLMLSSYSDTPSRATIADLRVFSARELRTLQAISGTVPAEAQPALRAAVLALRDIDARAAQVCATCSDLPPLRVPGLFLASTEVDRAMAGLDGAPFTIDHPGVGDRGAVHAAAKGQPATREAHRDAPAADPSASATPLHDAPSAQAVVPQTSPSPQAQDTIKVPVKVPVTVKVPVPTTPAQSSSAAEGDDLGTGLGKAAETTLLPLPSDLPTLPGIQ
jgi:Domain of unknown function (DUF5667)